LLLAWVAAPVQAQETLFYQCVAANGEKTIQNEPCPAGSTQETRSVQSVRSFPAGAAAPAAPSPAAASGMSAPAPRSDAPVPVVEPEKPASISVAESGGTAVRAASTAPSSRPQPAISDGSAESTTFYQCTDADGIMQIQNQPCPRGSRQETRVMRGVRSFSTAPSGPAASPPPAPGRDTATPSPASGTAGPVISDAPAENITFYRCTDASGTAVVQNQPCPRGSRQEARVMRGVRSFSTASAGPSSASAPPAGEQPLQTPGPDAGSVASIEPPAKDRVDLLPPPSLSRCATPDGGAYSYFSESGTPGERCVPIRTVGLDGNPRTGAGEACEVIRDECKLLTDEALCEGWRQYLHEAESSWRFAHPDNRESRQREFLRLGRIVSESQCVAQ
jgi:hypothetical protein